MTWYTFWHAITEHSVYNFFQRNTNSHMQRVDSQNVDIFASDLGLYTDSERKETPNICRDIFTNWWGQYSVWEDGCGRVSTTFRGTSKLASLGYKVDFFLHLASVLWYFRKPWTLQVMPTAYWYLWDDGKLASSDINFIGSHFTWANHFNSLRKGASQREFEC